MTVVFQDGSVCCCSQWGIKEESGKVLVGGLERCRQVCGGGLEGEDVGDLPIKSGLLLLPILRLDLRVVL